MHVKAFASVILLTLAELKMMGAAEADVAPSRPSITCPTSSTVMARLELLFGMSRKDAAPVSDAEWQSFVDQEVTPRFPDGLTIVQAYGQWRNGSGVIIKEYSRVLMIWYQPKPESEVSIEAIREAYKARFRQESVMRVDGLSCVSF